MPAISSLTSSSSTAIAVGQNGSTNPAFVVDASTGTSTTCVKIKSAAAAGGVQRGPYDLVGAALRLLARQPAVVLHDGGPLLEVRPEVFRPALHHVPPRNL